MDTVNGFVDLAERIVKERKRLGLTQAALASAIGVSLSTQKRYEKGERTPDTDYLASLAKAGMDVVFVLTGQEQEDPFIQRQGLYHVVSVIQDFLQLYRGTLEQEFCDAAQEVIDTYKLHWSKPEASEQADKKLRDVLRKSPVVLPEERQLEELLGKVEFVVEGKQVQLSTAAKVNVLLALYRDEKLTGQRSDFATVERAVLSRAF